MTPRRPIGEITRGTTNPNRLRRVDNWLVHAYGPLLRAAVDPLVVDLGYGATPTTAVELRARLARVRPDVRVVGVEIDPARVAAAAPAADPPWLEFRRGGFELAGLRPVIVRALNVLRQYDEPAVAGAWATVGRHLAPGGVLVDGTCDELGRLGAWLTVTAAASTTQLTLAARLATLPRPAAFAERLPKALIHRNVPGEPIHALLTALDDAWLAAAPYATFGPRGRFAAAVAATRAAGWPIVHEPRRWRLGELSLPWPVPTGGS
ncbi:hypothetical protein GCM10009682_36430 [Luedemannella flava]|uniref:Class I SAM-dependent methyltransferase n=1 Tax=Luedemannella flava TaxID=349316 RepID=A0ABN2M897_9ACTN